MEYTNEIKSENAERSHGRQSVVLIALTVAMAIGLGAAGVLYASANERVTKLEAEKKALIESAKGENKAKPDIVNPNAPEEQGEYIVMKDWGVKIKIPDGSKSLGYEVHNLRGDRGVFFLGVKADLEKEFPERYKEYQEAVKKEGISFTPGMAIGVYTEEEAQAGHMKGWTPIFKNDKYKFYLELGHYGLCRGAKDGGKLGKVVEEFRNVLKNGISNL